MPYTPNNVLYLPSFESAGSAEWTKMWQGFQAVDTQLAGIVTPENNGAAGDGLTDDSAALSAADALGKTIVCSGNYLIDTNLTLTSPVQMAYPGKFIIASGKTLTINGPFDSGLYQCFDDQNAALSGVVFQYPARVKAVYPEWWGAEADGTTDCTEAIQAAINSGGSTFNDIKLSTGIYNVSAQLELPLMSKISGSHMLTTYIMPTASFTGNYIFNIITDNLGVVNCNYGFSDFTVSCINYTDVGIFNANICYAGSYIHRVAADNFLGHFLNLGTSTYVSQAFSMQDCQVTGLAATRTVPMVVLDTVQEGFMIGCHLLYSGNADVPAMQIVDSSGLFFAGNGIANVSASASCLIEMLGVAVDYKPMGCTFIGNTFENVNSTYLIKIIGKSQTYPAIGNQILGNRLEYPCSNKIYLAKAANGVIDGPYDVTLESAPPNIASRNLIRQTQDYTIGNTGNYIEKIDGVYNTIDGGIISPDTVIFGPGAFDGAPTNANDTGIKGTIRIDATHLYVCVATDTWLRATLATWP